MRVALGRGRGRWSAFGLISAVFAGIAAMVSYVPARENEVPPSRAHPDAANASLDALSGRTLLPAAGLSHLSLIPYGQAVLCDHSPHVVMKPLSLHWDEGVPYPQQQ